MKIALCFIISYEHILQKEQLWIDWIQPNKDIINGYEKVQKKIQHLVMEFLENEQIITFSQKEKLELSPNHVSALQRSSHPYQVGHTKIMLFCSINTNTFTPCMRRKLRSRSWVSQKYLTW